MKKMNLKQISKKISERKITIFVITLIFIILGTIYSYNFIVPEYKSTSKIIIGKTDLNATGASNPSDETIETYNQILSSRSIIKKAISELNEKESSREVSKKVEIRKIGKSDVLEISVINKNYDFANRLNTALTKQFFNRISEIYGIKKLYVIDEAKIQQTGVCWGFI